MNVLYVSPVEGPDATTEQLARLSPELKITTVVSAAQALQETRLTGGFRALLTSPWLAHNDTLALIVSLRRDRVPIAIVPVLTEAQRDFFASAVAAGADDVLLLRGETLLRANETLTRIKQSPHLAVGGERRRLRVLYVGADDRVWSLLEQIPFVTPERAAPAADGSCLVRVPGAADSELRCDAVIIDQPPGEAHPLQVLKSVKSQASDLSVLVLAPPGSVDVETAALDLGADDTMVKSGIYRRRLIATLRRIYQRFEIVTQHQTLRTREARLRQIVETLPQGVSVIGEDFTILAMNRIALELVGANKPTDVVGRDFRSFIEAERREEVAALMRRMGGGDPVTVRFDLVGADQTRRPVELAGAGLDRDARGGRGLVAVFREPADVDASPALDSALARVKELERLRETAEVELESTRTGWDADKRDLEMRLDAAVVRLNETESELARRVEVEARLADTLTQERAAWDEARRVLEAAAVEASAAVQTARAGQAADLDALRATQEQAVEEARREIAAAREAHETERREWAAAREALERERADWYAAREAFTVERAEWDTARASLDREREEARQRGRQESADAVVAFERDRQALLERAEHAERAREAQTGRASEFEREIVALRERVGVVERERDEAREQAGEGHQATERARELEREIVALRERVDVVERERHDARERTQTLEREFREASERADMRARERDELAAHLDQVRTGASTVEHRVRQAEAQLRDAEARWREAEARREESDGRVAEYAARHASLEARAEEREQALQALIAERDSAGRQLGELMQARDEFDGARRRAAEADARMAALQDELRQAAQEQAAERSAWQAERQDLELRLQHTSATAEQIVELRNRLREVDAALEHERAEIGRVARERDELGRRLSAVETTRAPLEQQVAHAAADRDAAVRRAEELVARVTEVERLYAASESRARHAASLVAERDELATAASTLRTELAALATALASERSGRDADRAEMLTIRQAMSQERSARIALRDDLDAANRKLHALSDALDVATNARRTLEREIEEARQALHGRDAELEARVRSLVHELAQVRASRTRLEDSPLVGRALTTREGDLVECNDAFARMFGYTDAADAMTRESTARVVALLAGPAGAELPGAAERGATREVTLRRADGQAAKLREMATLVAGEDGVVRVERVVVDVSAALALEDDLRQIRRQEEVAAMAAAMAPDLEAQLRHVAEACSQLRRTLGTGLARESGAAGPALDALTKRADEAASLVRQLLAFSQRQSRRPETTDLADALRRAEPTLRHLMGSHVDFRLVPGPSGPITESAGDLDQLLTSLAVAARDMLPMGGSVVVETDRVDLDATDARELAGGRAGAHLVVAVSALGYGAEQTAVTASLATLAARVGGHFRLASESNRKTSLEVYFPQP